MRSGARPRLRRWIARISARLVRRRQIDEEDLVEPALADQLRAAARRPRSPSRRGTPARGAPPSTSAGCRARAAPCRCRRCRWPTLSRSRRATSTHGLNTSAVCSDSRKIALGLAVILVVERRRSPSAAAAAKCAGRRLGREALAAALDAEQQNSLRRLEPRWPIRAERRRALLEPLLEIAETRELGELSSFRIRSSGLRRDSAAGTSPSSRPVDRWR